MRIALAILFGTWTVATAAAPAPPATTATAPQHARAERMTDRDLKALVDRLDGKRDRFEDALEGKLKSSILRGPNGEVDVDRFLTDFERSVNELKDRMGEQYVASTEAATVLRQASAIERFFRLQPPGTRGESEWNELAADFKVLAASYGTIFPTPDNASVRRLSRGELAKIADSAARGADQFRKLLDTDLKKDTSLDNTARTALVREVDELKKDGETVRSRVEDDQPASAEIDRLLARAVKIQQSVSGRQLPTATTAWTQLSTHLHGLAGAFNTTWAP